MNSGRWVIGGIFVVGLLAAGAAWWHRFQQVRYCLEFWGPDTAYLIRLAPEVDLMRLAPLAEIDSVAASASGAGEAAMLAVDGESYRVMGEWDISRAQGLAHAREALVQDQSFVESGASPDREPVWQYALRFRKGDREATLLFDLEQSMTRRLDQSVTSRIKIAEGLRTLFRENAESAAQDEDQERPLTNETP
jgi:hypothetical protein